MWKRLDQVIQEIDEQLADLPVHLLRSSKDDVVDEAAIQHRFVLIGIGEIRVAVAMDAVVEVGSLPAITPLPNLPGWILGIINVRSEILSIVDLADFLNMPAARTRSGELFVIFRYNECKAGILIDRIYGSVGKSMNDMTIAVPFDVRKEDRAFFKPQGFMVEDQPYGILDTKSLLSSSRFLNFQQLS